MQRMAEPRELTLRALILGLLLGLVFAVGNAYLGLKVGMTVSASIPAAVMSMAILRILPRKGTIQENNIVQTMASAGESLAGGAIFTIPALTFIGVPPSWWQVFAISMLGGILGVLMMIPLRHHLIVVEDKTLPYPEGTACAKILQAREGSRGKALMALWGILIGALYKTLMGIFFLWREVLTGTVWRLFTMSIDTTPALLGVGYLIGIRYALVMFSGGILAWWVLIPLIDIFGLHDIVYPGHVPIAQMSHSEIWSSYVRYIGTGAVAMGGMVSLFRLLPKLILSVHGHFKAMFVDATKSHGKLRTEKDIPFLWVIVGTIVVLILLYVLPQISFNWMAILLVLVLGFLFVGLTSLTVGIVGSSSNPVSGMMILTLLVTTLVFLGFGWVSTLYLAMAMMVGAVVGVALSIAGDTSQDLKTGFLVDATPMAQQLAMLIGLVPPAIIMGYVLHVLHRGYGFGTHELPAPQAVLMSIVVQGVMEKTLPFSLVLVGLLLGLAVELLGIRALPFALGIYLPVSTSSSIGLGGILSYIVKQLTPVAEIRDRGILFGSGIVAGDALVGVVIALLTVLHVISPSAAPLLPEWAGFIIYLALAVVYVWLTVGTRRSPVVS
jgi:putative OPT family oligopeptide transporter